jgi:hypothetical protein
VLSREGRRYIYMLWALTGPLLVHKPCYRSVSPWGVAPESVTRFLPGTGRGSQVTSVTPVGPRPQRQWESPAAALEGITYAFLGFCVRILSVKSLSCVSSAKVRFSQVDCLFCVLPQALVLCEAS